jgi:hypothetical protein
MTGVPLPAGPKAGLGPTGLNAAVPAEFTADASGRDQGAGRLEGNRRAQPRADQGAARDGHRGRRAGQAEPVVRPGTDRRDRRGPPSPPEHPRQKRRTGLSQVTDLSFALTREPSGP